MKFLRSEKNIVIILFVMVIVVFSFAQKESKKLEHLYINASVTPVNTPTATLIEKRRTPLSDGLR